MNDCSTFLTEAVRNSVDVIKGYRLGQALFNALPAWAVQAVAGTDFDPYYKDMSDYEAQCWINYHLIFDYDGEVVAVFDGNVILAERP